MNADELRALQAPLKQQYRDEPAKAKILAHAEAVLSADDIACTVPSWRGETVAGLHAAAGGSAELACSADMLLQALAACAGVTLRAVATAYGVSMRNARIVAEGEWDVRGTLGIDKNTPVGMTHVALRFELDADADDAKLQRMIETVERYCVIFQTLKQPPALSVSRTSAAAAP